MINTFRAVWWQLMEGYASSRVVHHRVELTTWIVQRDKYRHLLATARAGQKPFNPKEATAHWPSDEA